MITVIVQVAVSEGPVHEHSPSSNFSEIQKTPPKSFLIRLPITPAGVHKAVVGTCTISYLHFSPAPLDIVQYSYGGY